MQLPSSNIRVFGFIVVVMLLGESLLMGYVIFACLKVFGAI